MPMQRDPDSARSGMDHAADEMMGTGTRHMRLTRRQEALNEHWSYFRVAEHDAKSTGWDGRPVASGSMRDAISRGQFMPPGYEAAGDSLPFDYRRPIAPLGIVRNVVSRFTGLLFSHRRQPRMAVPGDDKTEDYLNAMLEHGQFWPTMIQARNHGGAMGSACVGFRFLQGSVQFEALDPRWTTPEFVGRGYTDPYKITVQYTYAKEEQDSDGRWKNVWYWYRRVIDTETDTVWVPVKCREKEPDWDYIKRNTVRHGLGFVPYEWIQNMRVEDAVDGDPDCLGCFDLVRAVDSLLSEVYSGTINNCLGGETEFISSEGVRRFNECAEGEALTVLTHTGSWKPAKVHSYGSQKLYTVTFGRGANTQTVRATAGHRWLLDDGRTVTTADLTPKTKILKPPHLIRDWSYDEATVEQREYWSQGFAYGDGSVALSRGTPHATKIRLCGAKGRFATRFAELGYGVTYPPSLDGEPHVWMRGYLKTLPSLAVDGFENVMAFVRGYLDADGSRNLKHPETSDINPFQGIQATGTESIDFIRSVFPVVGAYIVNEDDRTDQPTNFGVRTAQTVYFSLVLGFSNSPVAPYNVRKIEEGPSETVWCLEVEDDHSLVLPCGIVTRNCDPTLTINTEKDFSSIQKGSDNAIKLGQGGSAQYLELQGAGPRIGLEVLEKLEERVYRLTQCVPDSVLFQNSGEKTATEIERIFSSMFERADSFREQYGPPMIRIGQKLLQAVRLYTSIRETPDGRLIRGRVYVPPKVIQQPDGDTVEIPRAIGKGTIVQTKWPSYQRPSFTDQDTYQRVLTSLLSSDPKLLTKNTAIQLLAPVLDFDALKELHSLKKEEEDAANAEAASSEEEDTGSGVESNPASWKTALDAGIITLNEYREMALQLGAIPDGDLTMPQYRAKYTQVFVASTSAVSEKSVDVATGKLEADESRTQESHEMKTENHEEQKKDRKLARATAAASPPAGGGTSRSVATPGSPPGRPKGAPAGPASAPKPPAA